MCFIIDFYLIAFSESLSLSTSEWPNIFKWMERLFPLNPPTHTPPTTNSNIIFHRCRFRLNAQVATLLSLDCDKCRLYLVIDQVMVKIWNTAVWTQTRKQLEQKHRQQKNDQQSKRCNCKSAQGFRFTLKNVVQARAVLIATDELALFATHPVLIVEALLAKGGHVQIVWTFCWRARLCHPNCLVGFHRDHLPGT